MAYYPATKPPGPHELELSDPIATGLQAAYSFAEGSGNQSKELVSGVMQTFGISSSYFTWMNGEDGAGIRVQHRFNADFLRRSIASRSRYNASVFVRYERKTIINLNWTHCGYYESDALTEGLVSRSVSNDRHEFFGMSSSNKDVAVNIAVSAGAIMCTGWNAANGFTTIDQNERTNANFSGTSSNVTQYAIGASTQTSANDQLWYGVVYLWSVRKTAAEFRTLRADPYRLIKTATPPVIATPKAPLIGVNF